MSRFTPKLISTNNWNQLVFDFSRLESNQLSNTIYCLPDQKLINELLHPWGWKPPVDYQLENYLNRKFPTENSVRLCQAYSNYAVKRILSHYSDPEQSLIRGEVDLRKFCEEHSASYEYIESCWLVRVYFECMYPTLIDIKSWHSIAPHSSVDSADDFTAKAAKKAFDKMNLRENLLASRFPLWAITNNLLDTFFSALKRTDRHQDPIKEVLKYGDSVVRRRRKLKDAEKISRDFSLRQCWFCGEFHLSPIANNNNSSRYCADEKCKRSHNAWVQALKRKGESPASLGLPG